METKTRVKAHKATTACTSVPGPSLEVPAAVRHPRGAQAARYSDAKVANRDIRVWHLVIENGY